MPTIDTTINRLRGDFEMLFRLQERRTTEPANYDNAAERAEALARIDAQIRWYEDTIRGHLAKLVQFPPQHAGLQAAVDRYLDVSVRSDDFVFVMTKYPNNPPHGENDEQLARIIAAVKEAIVTRGYTPRLAGEPPRYLAGLWENIEVHLLCCARAIAIVENRFKPELNPNVAMEWGWMRAMRPNSILFLIDDAYATPPVDTQGFIKDRFAWDDPVPGIQRAIENFLPRRA